MVHFLEHQLLALFGDKPRRHVVALDKYAAHRTSMVPVSADRRNPDKVAARGRSGATLESEGNARADVGLAGSEDLIQQRNEPLRGDLGQ